MQQFYLQNLVFYYLYEENERVPVQIFQNDQQITQRKALQ